MNTALFCPPKYNGEFATLHWHDTRGWQVTLWVFGQPTRYTPHSLMSTAVMEIFKAGFVWANARMQTMFEQDVIIAGE